ncbi:hypothetical protein KQI49_09160 [Virgibacillus sp. MSJ-26]|uniref:hypothetical protein n=1 Tax=Virgibacillus sp. MSJ-26 TaxID=2841522 RepID=UPI001C1040EC|nr:hypothetical protein [Virgibacillus sp. MSJ-26]MBU5466989.1 hypothetical protein [Virgibacillus sp. MSJ-26]
MTNEEKERSFLDNIEKKDPLQIVVRGHLFLENELIHLLEATFPQKDCLDPSDLRFPMKVKLVGALGLLPKESISSYLKFNSLRNKFAHRLDMEITTEEIKKIINSLSKQQFYIFEKRNKDTNIEEDHIEYLRDIISIMFVELKSAVENIKKKGYLITDEKMGRRLKGILVNYNLEMNDKMKQIYGVEAHEPEDFKRIKRIKQELEESD